MCIAEASFGTSLGAGPWSYEPVSIWGKGKSRDDAYYKAFSDCNAVMTAYQTQAMAAGKRTDGGTCHVARCLAPGESLVR